MILIPNMKIIIMNKIMIMYFLNQKENMKLDLTENLILYNLN